MRLPMTSCKFTHFSAPRALPAIQVYHRFSLCCALIILFSFLPQSHSNTVEEKLLRKAYSHKCIAKISMTRVEQQRPMLKPAFVASNHLLNFLLMYHTVCILFTTSLNSKQIKYILSLCTTLSLPVFILEVMRERSIRRGGRMGVDVFVVLAFCLSKGLLILDRGAKIPVKKT